MTAGKWQKRYENQLAANNILSERLRGQRKSAITVLTRYRAAVDAANKQIVVLLARIKELEDE